MPNFSGPLNASPESLTMTRRYFGFAIEMPAPRRGRSSQDTVIRFATENPNTAYNNCRPHSVRTGKGSDLTAEIAAGTFDPLAEAKTHKSSDLDRCTDLCLNLFDSRSHAFLIVEDEALVQQTNLLVEGLQAGFDDLIDHIGGLALRLGLVGQHSLLALDGGGIQAGRIDCLWIGGGD